MSYKGIRYLKSKYLRQLLAVFFLFEFLPVPVNFDVLFVRGNDFVLNFVCPLLALLLLVVSAVIFSLINFGFNLSNGLVGVSAHLLDVACQR